MTLYVVEVIELIFTLILLLTLKSQTDDRKKRKLIGLLMGGAGLTAAVSCVAVKLCLAASKTALLKRGLVCAEFVFFSLIALAVFIVYSKKQLKGFKPELTQAEKRIGIFSLILGAAVLLYMMLQNPRYIMPSDEFGYISKLYFNADIDRAVLTAVNFDFSVPIHALYRLVLFPINFVLLVIGCIIRKINADSAYVVNIISGYLLCLVQICLNSTCAVLIKRLLKNFGEKNSSMGAYVFAVCFSSFWVSVLPETYASALFLTLLALWLESISNIFWIPCAVAAIGVNPFTAVAFISGIIHIIAVNRTKFREKKKTVFIIAACAAVLLIFTIPFAYKIVLKPYVFKWSDFEFFSLEKIIDSFSTIVTPWFVGTSFNVSAPFFVQMKSNGIFLIVLTAVFFIICCCGAVLRFKEKIVQSAVTVLLFGLILHVFMGYGRYNGMIYSPLYGWAAVVLITACTDGLLKKLKKQEVSYILPATAAIMIACNVIWLFKMGINTNEFEFKKESEKMPIGAYISGDSYLIDGNRLVRTTDYAVLADNVDCARIYQNRVSALCNDGSTILIEETSEGGRTLVDFEEAKESHGETQFFIFGMGPREKFIFRRDGEFYDLASYPDGEIVLDNVKCLEITPEEYRVRVEKDGAELWIYENANGIYISDEDGNSTVLSEGVKINIPGFNDRKYRRELRMLLNEVTVNITNESISPNFMAYEGSWYRDAAIMAMVLEKTGNTAMLDGFLSNVTELYDFQNGVKEGDNLGQLLYLLSLGKNKNEELISAIITEAESHRDADGALNCGTTDGEAHRAYQTRWLKFGMESLGIDSSAFVIPQDENDDYAQLMWFDGYSTSGCPEKTGRIWNRWPYIYYAKSHFYSEKIDFTRGLAYPISQEYQPSMADFEKLSAADPMLTELKLVAPHGWSAAELFMLLYNVEG